VGEIAGLAAVAEEFGRFSRGDGAGEPRDSIRVLGVMFLVAAEPPWQTDEKRRPATVILWWLASYSASRSRASLDAS
jgi:hypothetical protein